jgi:hypothetical protein
LDAEIAAPPALTHGAQIVGNPGPGIGVVTALDQMAADAEDDGLYETTIESRPNESTVA